MSSDGHLQGYDGDVDGGGQGGPDNIAAPQLKPFFLSLLPQAPCGRLGLSTTSSLRDSEAESRVDVYD